jgi:hypothetical protein
MVGGLQSVCVISKYAQMTVMSKGMARFSEKMPGAQIRPGSRFLSYPGLLVVMFGGCGKAWLIARAKSH